MTNPPPAEPQGFGGQFRTFLLETNALSLALGVVIGAAIGKVVSALVEGLIMPIISLVIPGGNWRDWKIVLQAGTAGPDCPAAVPTDAKCHVGEKAILIGQILGTTLDFFIVALVVFIIAKRIMKVEVKR
jgi:large conductance mechanosensitive channel